MRIVVLIWRLPGCLFPRLEDRRPIPVGQRNGFSWAFPEPSPDFPPEDNSKVEHLPGSSKAYTQGQVDDIYNPPDWYPDEHVPFPRVVASGEGKATPGCASCHLASGSGHPESANLTGLTNDYIVPNSTTFNKVCGQTRATA